MSDLRFAYISHLSAELVGWRNRAVAAEREVARLRAALFKIAEHEDCTERALNGGKGTDCLTAFPIEPAKWCPICKALAAITHEGTA